MMMMMMGSSHFAVTGCHISGITDYVLRRHYRLLFMYCVVGVTFVSITLIRA